MKIKPEHYEIMKTKIKDKLKGHDRSLKECKAIYTNAGPSDIRFAWDCFYMAELSRFACDVLYPDGLHDQHIQTALFKIVKELIALDNV